MAKVKTIKVRLVIWRKGREGTLNKIPCTFRQKFRTAFYFQLNKLCLKIPKERKEGRSEGGREEGRMDGGSWHGGTQPPSTLEMDARSGVQVSLGYQKRCLKSQGKQGLERWLRG